MNLCKGMVSLSSVIVNGLNLSSILRHVLILNLVVCVFTFFTVVSEDIGHLITWP